MGIIHASHDTHQRFSSWSQCVAVATSGCEMRSRGLMSISRCLSRQLESNTFAPTLDMMDVTIGYQEVTVGLPRCRQQHFARLLLLCELMVYLTPWVFAMSTVQREESRCAGISVPPITDMRFLSPLPLRHHRRVL